jgi:hypothetical protein|tara:strand:+ start:41 stop:625 length:585 start_codon:yes stop_codon:yes gene_type:complete
MNNSNMADNLIRVYDNVIDEVSCKMLIEKFEDSHEHYQTVHQEDGDERISFEQLILVEHEEWESVQNGMLELFQDYIMRYKIDCLIGKKMWPETYGYEAIRIKRYLANDYDRFDPHVDVIDHNSSRRFLSFFIYLNDVDEGGETEFSSPFWLNRIVKPKRGRLLMFPPMWPWVHAGKKPVSGRKYLINSYCHYE